MSHAVGSGLAQARDLVRDQLADQEGDENPGEQADRECHDKPLAES